MPEDKLEKRYEALDKLIDLLPYGKCVIHWADKVIVKIEQIDAKESVITK